MISSVSRVPLAASPRHQQATVSVCSAHQRSRDFQMHRAPGHRGASHVVRTSAGEDSIARNERETPEETAERRKRESAAVESRIVELDNLGDWEAALETAGDDLMVVEITSDVVCETGHPEPDRQWKEEEAEAFKPCVNLKHTLQRTARECKDIQFLHVAYDAESAASLIERLDVDVVPSVQFWKGGRRVWQHKGHEGFQQNTGEGVLFYGDTAGGGTKASDFVQEVSSVAQLEAWTSSQEEDVLAVLDVSISTASPCVHIFPAVVALAKNMAGFAAFARLTGDRDKASRTLMEDLNVKDVPTFVFFKGGREVKRFIGSSRGDLIGQILELQARFGRQPPEIKRRQPPRQPVAAPARPNPWG